MKFQVNLKPKQIVFLINYLQELETLMHINFEEQFAEYRTESLELKLKLNDLRTVMSLFDYARNVKESSLGSLDNQLSQHKPSTHSNTLEVKILDQQTERILKEMNSTQLSYVEGLTALLPTLEDYDKLKIKKELYTQFNSNPGNIDISVELQKHFNFAASILGNELNIQGSIYDQIGISEKLKILINQSKEYAECCVTSVQTFNSICESLACNKMAESSLAYNLKQLYNVKRKM